MLSKTQSIRLFVAAYEERSFTAAAERENATQSGVSQHIRNLERSLGVALFLRDRGRPVPTPAGDSYYRRCIDVLRAHEAATNAVRTFARGLVGQVHIGLMPTMTRCALGPALARFLDEQPNVLVRVIEGYSAMLTEKVRSGELDFAIVPAFPASPGIRSRLFLQTPEVLISAAISELGHLAPVRLAELGPLSLALAGRANTRRATLEAYFEANRIEVARIVELDAMLATLDLVARTSWTTILPAIIMAEQPEPRQFTVNPLVDPPLHADLVLIEPSRKALSPAAGLFLTELERETRRLNKDWTKMDRVTADGA